MTEDLRRRLAETAAGARNSIAGDGGAESWLDKLCRAEGVADWPEQRLRDTSEMLDVLSETGRQARAVATGIQPVGGSGFAAAVTYRLPLNRKERYYTGTVLPMIVAGDGFMHLHRLLALCGLDHVQVQDDGATPLQGQQDVQFFTEYNFAESVFRPEDMQRFDTTAQWKRTPLTSSSPGATGCWPSRPRCTTDRPRWTSRRRWAASAYSSTTGARSSTSRRTGHATSPFCRRSSPPTGSDLSVRRS